MFMACIIVGTMKEVTIIHSGSLRAAEDPFTADGSLMPLTVGRKATPTLGLGVGAPRDGAGVGSKV